MDFKKIKNKEKFNSFFLNSDCCHFLQSLEWGEIMKEEGWENLPYIVEDQGEIKASILVLKKKIPVLGGSILYAPRAPVAKLEDTPVINYLLSELKNLGKEHRAIFLRIDPDIGEDNQQMNSIFLKNGFRKLPQTWSYWNAPKYLLRLKLMGTEEELFSK
ncbi:MAG: aminoacyltransferase, partial [candidate division Zixibacteria bacterium]|nr:aminoacyltransferase [candidate division Zixibacteria bacterium]